jgi:ABC-type antimicrobial peptide transport system ATPase subunit
MSTKVSQYTNKAGEQKIGVEHHINDSVIVRHTSKAIEAATFTPVDEAPF